MSQAGDPRARDVGSFPEGVHPKENKRRSPEEGRFKDCSWTEVWRSAKTEGRAPKALVKELVVGRSEM
jgi:hypothetical protein